MQSSNHLYIRYELAERLSSTNITVNTCDPGTVNTKMLLAGWGRIGVEVSSADDETFLATSPSLEGVSGKYFVRRRANRSAASTYDRHIRQKLWSEMETMTNVVYPEPS